MPKAAGSTKTRVERGPDVFSRRLYTRPQAAGRGQATRALSVFCEDSNARAARSGEGRDRFFPDHAVEARGRLAELERNLADGPVAVLGDLGLHEINLALRVLLTFAVQEDHHVGVLLDRAGLAQIR